ncbi:DUF222 domain-containing protein [Actinopolymorpha sp. B17G11]|uniref:HNH endonuclease signature motif containing protein n=1 Tax=Actinopolymorpha sp. B17G11 TaxID=3160861 RepID=UPI0032E5171C
MFDPRVPDLSALASAAPGPELAAVLAGIDVAAVNGHARVVVMAAWERQVSWSNAQLYGAMGMVARSPACEPDSPPELDRCFGEFASAEVGAALGLSPGSADRELSFAYELTERLPGTRAALAAGSINLGKARTIAEETSWLAPELARRAEEFILAADAAVGLGLTRAQLVRRLRRKVLELDPDGAEERRREAQQGRRIRFGANPDGTGSITGQDLPMAGTAAARVFVKSLAKRIKGDGDGRTLAQIEADVFLDLLRGRNPAANPAVTAAAADPATTADQTSSPDPAPGNPDCDCDRDLDWNPDRDLDLDWNPDRGPASGPVSGSAFGSASRSVTEHEVVGDVDAWDAPGDGGACVEAGDERLVAKVELVADLETWLRLGEKAGELAGLGAITPAVIDDIKNAAAGGFEYCRTVTIDGKVVYHQASSRRYKPTPAQRRLIQATHRTCAQPGCSRPATACDLDHTIEHRLDGPSCLCNMAPLCRRHHRAKHEAGWWWTQNQPGHLTTQSPLGHTYTVDPEPPPSADAIDPATGAGSTPR